MKYKKKASGAFLKKSVQKIFFNAGAGMEIAFKRRRRRRLRAVPVPRLAGQKFFARFFFKKAPLPFYYAFPAEAA